MNPIQAFFALAARQADIRRAFAIWNQVRAPMTTLIDIIRSIADDVGLLAPKPQAPSVVPPLLKQYGTEWVQTSLNTLMNAGLVVDGDLGGENSKTRQAVRKFQEAHNLKVDGAPGVQTVAVMVQELDKIKV